MKQPTRAPGEVLMTPAPKKDDDRWLCVAQTVSCTEAEGPGRRFALWFQGCPLRCPGCCNPEMLPFTGGQCWSLGTVVDLIRTAARDHRIEGITLLGGEPFRSEERRVGKECRAS